MSDNECSDRTPWLRRDWIKANGTALGGLVVARGLGTSSLARHDRAFTRAAASTGIVPDSDLSTWELIAQRGVEAAHRAGATYADARITRTVVQRYDFVNDPGECLMIETEINAVGIRALVNGAWGFSATTHIGNDTVDRLARDAVAQSKVNALAGSHPVELAPCAPARGRWKTPIAIDPFALSLEEKSDYIASWLDYAAECGAPLYTQECYLQIARQERTVATSEGSLFSLTTYESAAAVKSVISYQFGDAKVAATGVDAAARGWELFLDAKLEEQIRGFPRRLRIEADLLKNKRTATVGRYTFVCDGATMATLSDQTIGIATQLDRALGYEANAGGTSLYNDPLSMLGSAQVAAPLVNVTAHRNVPGQLATVPWDDEGVEPKPFTVVKEGILNDFQTTREQAPWLASYYNKVGRPMQSHGCAAAENGLSITMQHTPNVALDPSKVDGTLDDLVASVTNGILMTEGEVSTDFQGSSGFLRGRMRRITNGRVGPLLTGGAISFRTADLWKHISALGGQRSMMTTPSTQYGLFSLLGFPGFADKGKKGQPAQITGHSASAPAATIQEQALIDPTRRV